MFNFKVSNHSLKYTKRNKQLKLSMDNQRCHVNPFVHRMSLSSRQKVQIFIMSFTLAPIRFFFAFSTLLVTWVMGYVFTLGASSDFTLPVCSFRQKLYNFLRKMGSLVGFFCGIHFQVVFCKFCILY